MIQYSADNEEDSWFSKSLACLAATCCLWVNILWKVLLNHLKVEMEPLLNPQLRVCELSVGLLMSIGKAELATSETWLSCNLFY